LTAK
jgi:hypothetical protein